MKFNFLFKSLVLSLFAVFVISCDKDFNEIGTDIIGEDHYNFDKYNDASVVAYNQKVDVVQTNNLPLNALGYYNNPVFGKTKASFVTQVELVGADPKFFNPSEVQIDSVYLYVPYFINSAKTVRDSETGDSTYELDSIQGGTKKIKLSLYESGYYLRDFDASSGLQQPQRYYSNQTPEFTAAIVNNSVLNNNILNDEDDVTQNNEFVFSNKEIKLTYVKDGETKVKQRLAPGMFLNLNKQFFKNKIANAPAGKLLNNNVFKNYFKGIYFKVDAATTDPDGGSMAMMDFSKGEITIVYRDETSSTNTTRVRKTLILKTLGNSVNLFENDDNTSYLNNIAAANPTLGDEKLYLKGQQGAMAVISLFGEANPITGKYPELQALKANGWLINEANLTFYIDKDAMGTAPEPNRIYLYDINNRRPLLDYFDDTTLGATEKFNKRIHGGIIEVDDAQNPRGVKYKVKLTRHIRNLINNDSTNVKLGLVVTENIGNVTTARLKTPLSPRLDRVPFSSVINPLGTVIYGSKASPNVPEAKRMKLEIFYTKPE